MPLRPYQQAAVDNTLAWLKYKDAPAIVSIPTGGGKTHVFAELIEHYYRQQKRVCLLAHRKELLQQSITKLHPDIQPGIYSAGMGEKDLSRPVIIAGIQSIYNKELPAPFDVLLIDECHRVPNSEEGQYWQFIHANPGAKIVGMTATPHRLKGGKLTWGNIVYEAHYDALLKDGYLAPITNKVKDAPDLSGVTVTAGEYTLSQLEEIMADSALVESSIRHIMAYGEGRKSVLIFAVSVAHTEILADIMRANGLEVEAITGETPADKREATIEHFKAGELKHLINCEVLLEGFDAPCTDTIICLRPTKSKGLWEQMLGRGVRTAPGKTECLLVDMAGNLMEHGPLGTPYREPGRGEKKRPAGRICPECESFCKPQADDCPDCGYTFIKDDPPKVDHNYTADTESRAEYVPIEEYNVTDVTYSEHISKEGKRSIKVTYHCPRMKYGTISEWLPCWSTSERARNKAHKFFAERGWNAYGDIGEYDAEALLFHAENLSKPAMIRVDYNDRWPRIIGYSWQKSEQEDDGVNYAALDELLDDEIPF